MIVLHAGGIGSQPGCGLINFKKLLQSPGLPKNVIRRAAKNLVFLVT
jgi:hypothetical protein